MSRIDEVRALMMQAMKEKNKDRKRCLIRITVCTEK